MSVRACGFFFLSTQAITLGGPPPCPPPLPQGSAHNGAVRGGGFSLISLLVFDILIGVGALASAAFD